MKYRLSTDKAIESKGKNNLSLSMKIVMKMMNIQASYSRFTANGELEIMNKDNRISRNGALIYEIMCPDIKCAELMDTA